jgi:hypothetical protein
MLSHCAERNAQSQRRHDEQQIPECRFGHARKPKSRGYSFREKREREGHDPPPLCRTRTIRKSGTNGSGTASDRVNLLHETSRDKRSRLRTAGNSKMRGRPFKKGRSGNPGGRPKVVSEIQALAREKSPGMIEILEEIARSAKSHPQARVAAARELLTVAMANLCSLRRSPRWKLTSVRRT